VSNPIRYDPLLVRALAAELRAALQGRSLHPQPVFDRDLSCTLLLDRGEALRLDLHPSRGWIRLSAKVREGESANVREDDGELSARVLRVTAPPDERLLRIDLHDGGRFRGARRTLVVELHTNQWNALLVDSDDRRIVSVLRARDAGERVLRAGTVYRPPHPPRRILPDRPRDLLWEAWTSALAPLPPAERPRELVRRFAYASPLNAAALLGTAATTEGDAALEDAFERWWEVADGDDAGAFVLRGSQPYPLALEGMEPVRVESLLGAMETIAQAAPAEVEEEKPGPDLTGQARRRATAAEKRVERLRGELAGAGEAERLRAQADLLLAHLDWAQPGDASVVLPDFDGGEVEVALDPRLRPHENAERLYDEARRLARAEARLPGLLDAAAAEAERWSGAVAALERGEVPEWVEGALRRPDTRERRAAPQTGERLPYRLYRTSGGLDVRVGRSSKDNDRLTFGHAAHADVWLHARSVPGSHVVLRWTDEGAPPARDLEEAAVLAAFYSKARTSGTVAVDWTRRKYVRKPRGAPPGRVTISHARTIFVAPDPAVEERLRVEAAS
jgi:predicted ribosome quality control (RQC) complex YloA/Tae2 family protein